MKTRRSFPLLAKVLAWLCLHLSVMALTFLVFMSWQLGLGLESLLSGAAGDRLRAFGDAAKEQIQGLDPGQWDDAVESLAAGKKVTARFYGLSQPDERTGFPIPRNVIDRIKQVGPAPQMRGERRGPPPQPPRDTPRGDFEERNGMVPRRDGRGRPDRNGPDFPGFPDGPEPMNEGPGAPRNPSPPSTRPLFLVRGDHGDGYWAGIELFLGKVANSPPKHALLLIRSDRMDGSGMFFEVKPWVVGGLAVLVLSLAFWAPFVWRITRYINRLTLATARISAGDFRISLPPRGQDELGELGLAIETMAGRLDHLITGQKRFLGDAAHELCAPLARMRTGLGILEMNLAGEHQPRITQIEDDARELASLIEEVLAFSRAENREPAMKEVVLRHLVQQVVTREGIDGIELRMPEGLRVIADPALLGRAIGNLIRNASIHGGRNVRITVEAQDHSSSTVEVSVTDNGPGVSPDELRHLFEPFYRPDPSRTRQTGGAGLGMAIVRTAIEACHGKAYAILPSEGGFSVVLRLRKA